MDKLFPSAFAALKGEIEPLQTRRAELMKRQAPAFDILGILNVEHLESTHSKILAHLLNPIESHAQGALFLRQFLSRLGITDALIDADLSQNIQVESECIIKEIKDGRLDLLIRIPPAHVIVLENKIGSSEGIDQLRRYQAWLSRQPQQHKALVYLTPRGDDDSSEPSAVPDHWLSYGSDVVEWLTSCLPSLDRSSRLYGFLIAYIDRAKRIGGAAMDQDNEMIEFLTKEDNILTAYDVWHAFSQVSDRLKLTFWRKTETKIKTELNSSEWIAGFDPYHADLLTDDWPGIVIQPRGLPKTSFF